MRSHKRVDYARSWLEKIDMEPDRLKFVHVPPMDRDALDTLLKEFKHTLESFEETPAVANI